MRHEAKLAVLRHLKGMMNDHEAKSIHKHRSSKMSEEHPPEEKDLLEHEMKEEEGVKEAQAELNEEHPILAEKIEIKAEEEKKQPEHDEEGIPLDKEKRKAHFLKRMGR